MAAHSTAPAPIGQAAEGPETAPTRSDPTREIPALAVTGPDAVRLKSGNPILIRANQFAKITEGRSEGSDLQGLTVFLSTVEGEPVALAEFAQGELRPFRVFNL